MNNKIEITINLSQINNRTEEQSQIIQNFLRKNHLLECEVLGNKTVRQISKGRKFDSVEGGRHLSLIETISLLSAIATLIQSAILVISYLRDKTAITGEQETTEVKQLLKQLILENEELKEIRVLIEKDYSILDKAVEQVFSEIQNINKPSK